MLVRSSLLVTGQQVRLGQVRLLFHNCFHNLFNLQHTSSTHLPEITLMLLHLGTYQVGSSCSTAHQLQIQHSSKLQADPMKKLIVTLERSKLTIVAAPWVATQSFLSRWIHHLIPVVSVSSFENRISSNTLKVSISYPRPRLCPATANPTSTWTSNCHH